MKKERAAFALAFGRLALAHHIEADQPTMEVYWESLKDIPIQQVVAALAHLTTHAAGFFPKPGEIRRAVDELPAPPRPMLAAGNFNGSHYCAGCEDTCWMAAPDGRVARCHCWPDNPVYLATHPTRLRKYFDGRE